MGAIGNLYNSIYNGLGLIAVPLLSQLHDFLAHAGIESWGLTIILFTVVVKLVFWPLTIQQIRASRAMQEIQPKLNELKKIHGKDREKMMQEQMRLYKEHSVNPAAGCLPLLIQFPIWIALYGGLRILADQHQLSGGFLWIHSLAQPEGVPYILAILTAGSQWVVQRMLQTQTADPQQKQMQQMMQFMPLMYLFFSVSVPAGLVLYWVVSNVFTMIQQSFYTGWDSVFFWRPAPAVAAAARPRRVRTPVESVEAADGIVEEPVELSERTANDTVNSTPTTPSTPSTPNGMANGTVNGKVKAGAFPSGSSGSAPRRGKKRRK